MDYTDEQAVAPPVTVVETPTFWSRADTLLTADEPDALIAYVAANGRAGALVRAAGGIRKFRWALARRGKSGGARVIDFVYSLDLPVSALTMCAKNERVDLSQGERSEFRQLTRILVNSYGRKKR